MPWRESPADVERARAEQPVIVPAPGAHLVGIYTPPAVSSPDLPCVIWFTIPRSHRNRMWVEAARRLATRGFPSFRFDYHGVGDSGGESAKVDPNRPYRDDALAVLRHLRATMGHQRFVLFGSCFDARTALSAFDGEADAIDGIVFMAAPVMELDDMVRAHADRKGWSHLLGALRRPSNWHALRDPGRWRYMRTVLGRVARKSTGHGNGAGPKGGPPLSQGFVEHFQHLVHSRARALFLYGREDREYVSFRRAEQGLWPKLSPEARERLAIELWDGKVHDGTLEMTTQRRIVARVVEWIGTHGAPLAEPRRA